MGIKSKTLPVIIESAPALAKYLGVGEVTLVRDDLLESVGGKKYRSLLHVTKEIPAGKPIHVFSYQGSHTAFTLSALLPNHTIILYGKSYPGGAYRDFMTRLLSRQSNVIQYTGSLWAMMAKYLVAKLQNRDDRFMNLGGALGKDQAYITAAKEVFKELGNSAYHIVPVASGDLLNALRTTFHRVTGILTQPWYLRIIQRLRLKSTKGIVSRSYSEREKLVYDIYHRTGFAFDPVFMGSTLDYCRRKGTNGDHICLWVTCPNLATDFILSLDSSDH